MEMEVPGAQLAKNRLYSLAAKMERLKEADRGGEKWRKVNKGGERSRKVKIG
jgi:hypothetical protein